MLMLMRLWRLCGSDCGSPSCRSCWPSVALLLARAMCCSLGSPSAPSWASAMSPTLSAPLLPRPLRLTLLPTHMSAVAVRVLVKGRRPSSASPQRRPSLPQRHIC